LEYYQKLGCTAIWSEPGILKIIQSISWVFAIQNYLDVDKGWGTKADSGKLLVDSGTFELDMRVFFGLSFLHPFRSIIGHYPYNTWGLLLIS